MSESENLGVVVSGSLSEGLQMRLAEGRSIEDLRAGRFVVVRGQHHRFFAMITDVRLQAVSPDYLRHSVALTTDAQREVVRAAGTYALVELRPMLMLEEQAGEPALRPVKTVPVHFSTVHEASAEDVARIFGSEGQEAYFSVGTPLEMEASPVCLDLVRFAERSNAVFGKSGTGKTFLTRLLLAGLIRHRVAVNLVFDMHSEYGWQADSEGGGRVKGLKQLFQDRVAVYALDEGSAKRRGVKVEQVLRIPLKEVDVEDVILLAGELNLNPTAVETSNLLENRYGRQWLPDFLAVETGGLKALAEEIGAHAGALSSLHRKLRTLRDRCRGFLVDDLPREDDAVARILDHLRQGVSVVVEFGSYARPLQYMLVVNMLTRRIHEEYVKRTEESQGGGSDRPQPLVITIEEAHKFLSPQLAGQTIFGTIARELRKYSVTLLIVDQRPSGIDDEVLSQVGTKLLCLLDDERDVQAALSGTPASAGLRGILARLETRQQALVLGHAVPMPVVLRTRTYGDEEFLKAMVLPSQRPLTAEDRDRDFA